MKHIFSISCAAFLSLVLLATSCKKGDTGPEGPAGPAGPQGPQGPGGSKGDTGVANVIYSQWLDVGYDEIRDTATDGSISVIYVGGIGNITKLTSAIVNQGDVKVYLNYGSAQEPLVIPMPSLDIIVFFEPQVIYFQAGQDWSTYIDPSDSRKYNQYRYILIPGGVPARSAINWNNYASVKKYLNLPD